MWRGLAVALMALAAPLHAQEFFTLRGHGGPIMDIAVSPSGRVATASFDNAVGVWQSDTPLWLEGSRAAVNAVQISGNLVFAGGDDFTLRQWQIGNEPPSEIGRHKGKIAGIAIADGGALVASASWDGSIGLWRKRMDGYHGTFLVGHTQGVNDVALSADRSTLFSASADGTIRVWDVASGATRQVLVKHGFGVNKLILNEKDGWLAYGAVDGGTRLVDVGSGELIADFTLERRPILALSYDPAGQQLAVGDGEGYIMIIDTDARQITRDFRATQRGPIWALAFSPSGQNIHAAGIENIMYSWPIDTMSEHGQMSAETRSFLEDPATLSNGERQFKRKCSICHTLTRGSARRAGPSLHDLFGRRAGTVPDYRYSDTLIGSDIVWSAETIDALFDEGPDHYIPGTKMPMQRIAEQKDRTDLIDYLRSATAAGKD